MFFSAKIKKLFHPYAGSIDKPINAQALIHSALYSQPCKLNFVGAQATGIYLTVQCFIEKESNAQVSVLFHSACYSQPCKLDILRALS